MHWEGEGFDYDDATETIYFTFGHVDLENDIVRRALASVFQRDGLADSLSDGFHLIDSARAHCAFAGLLPGGAGLHSLQRAGRDRPRGSGRDRSRNQLGKNHYLA